ncbi:alpha/beta hydrolase [Corynebacterium mayonis]|uniref:alpha/beta hydrolase n=1 Tax=Corynebacterium mayonis TaxID=3062461 RepID=UPI0031407D8A
MSAVYSPALRTGELYVATRALNAAADLVEQRGTSAAAAVEMIRATGFAGPAANVGLAKLNDFSESFYTRADALRRAAEILSAAASVQLKLDEFAALLLSVSHNDMIVWLNLVSWALDSAAAQGLYTALRGRGDGDFHELIYRPYTPLEQIHELNLTTVPASTAEAVSRAGGLILEASPQRASVIVGDITNPERITTMVAGVSTGKPDDLSHELERAATIAKATGGAVVVWQGYEPPPSVAEGIDPGAARAGGEALSRFQIALDLHYPDAQKTVLSHSYGTVVAARAAKHQGLIADDLWLLGSPGVPVSHVDEMILLGDQPRVFVADSDRDLIRFLRNDKRGVHGFSPSAPSFGATVVPGVEGGHSAYFTDPDLLRALSQPPP